MQGTIDLINPRTTGLIESERPHAWQKYNEQAATVSLRSDRIRGRQYVETEGAHSRSVPAAGRGCQSSSFGKNLAIDFHRTDLARSLVSGFQHRLARLTWPRCKCFAIHSLGTIVRCRMAEASANFPGSRLRDAPKRDNLLYLFFRK